MNLAKHALSGLRVRDAGYLVFCIQDTRERHPQSGPEEVLNAR
jgi:hypothetical protein